MYAAVMFLSVENSSAVQRIISIERTVLHRKRAAAMYSALPYAFGKVQIHIPRWIVTDSFKILETFWCLKDKLSCPAVAEVSYIKGCHLAIHHLKIIQSKNQFVIESKILRTIEVPDIHTFARWTFTYIWALLVENSVYSTDILVPSPLLTIIMEYFWLCRLWLSSLTYSSRQWYMES